MVSKILLSCACCLQVLAVLATGNRTIDQSINSQRFPDADTVTVDEIEKVRYNPDGTYEQTDECWTKILTEKGRRAESSMSLDYSKRYSEAKILFVKAIGTDGTEREIDVSKTTKESTDNSSMSANIYDPLDRKITCTIPGLKIGETLHVKTMRKATKPRCENKWADLAVMEWSHPIVKGTYEVTAPASRPLKKIAIRNPLGNVVTNVTKLADGSLVHTFTVTNSAQAFAEPDMPPMYTQIQNVRVSTAADWPEISKWYWDLCAPHLAKTNAAMIAKVKELMGGDGEGAVATMKRIFKFVSQEVRYMGLTMEDTSPGYAPHDVDITFNNRYGVCRDKAGLLVAMLRLAGFKAFPVLIHVGAKLDPEVPQPFFNHAIVAVEEGVEQRCRRTEEGSNIHCRPTPSTYTYILMDPTNENTKDLFPSYLCNNSYLVARPEGEQLATSPVPPPEENDLGIDSKATLSRDGSMFFETAIALGGINDTAYRGALVKRTPEERVKTFERILKASVAGAELVKCEIEPKDLRDTSVPMSVKLAAKFPEMVIRGETRDELSVPSISKTLGLVNWLLEGNTSLEKRRFALKLDTTARVREHLTIDLGQALGEALELPRSEKTSNGYDYERTFAVTNGTLTMDRSLTISAVEFTPEQYQNLREEIKRVEAAERKKPVFVSDRLHDANVRQILDSSETTLFSDYSWVTTNIDVTEVLTYKGKKDSAELKFNYHPSWKRIDILEATVSNRDGKVYSVSPTEVNEMDCGWASAAPRYPAGKIKIVNLPSVEIGSVISVKTVVTVTNAPAPFYTCMYFDSFSPVDRLVRRVDDFKHDSKKVKRLPDEPSQPDGTLWRDHKIISRGEFGRIDLAVGTKDMKFCRARDIRDWMIKRIKIVGPGLYELPIGLQLTPPEEIIRECYATRLDYIRTLCALLRGAGYEADVVFAANDADDPEAIRNRIKFEKPNVRAFSTALCRVRVREGGFLWFGGETKEYFIGTENQYAPIGPTAYEGCDYFDPESGEFGLVTVPEEKFSDFTAERSEYIVRENGAVDLTVENEICGSGVGGFRKTYSEMLPEIRSRRYQALLGNIAQAASATSELATDTEGYPARQKFSCFIPDFATVQGDAITIQIPPLVSSIPSLTGTARQTPFAVSAADQECERVTIRFPEGYTEIESLPKMFNFCNPNDKAQGWVGNSVHTEIKDNCLTVTLSRGVLKRISSWFEPTSYELVKDWSRIANSRANRTITVRRRAAAAAPKAILAPARDAVVPVLTARQKAHLDQPRDVRTNNFNTAAYRRRLRGPDSEPGWYPEPLTLAWEGDPAGTYAVTVRRTKDGSLFCRKTVRGTSCTVDNFEIGCRYEWTVSGAGKSLSSTFSTEDRAPRILRDPTVPNVRDLGGRKTSFGRRIRQNRIFRTAGLNDNAYSPQGKDLENAIRAMVDGPDKDRVEKCYRTIAEFRRLSSHPELVNYVTADWGDGTWNVHDVVALSSSALDDIFAGGKENPVTAQAKVGKDGFVRFDGQGLVYLDRDFTVPADGYVVMEVTADWFWALELDGRIYANNYACGNERPLTQYHHVLLPVKKGANRIGIVLKNGSAGWCLSCRPCVPGTKDYAHRAAERLEYSISYLFKCTGKTRINADNEDFWRHWLGIRSDIDLRSDGECYGMKGSPLGPSVTWFHYSSQCYEGFGTEKGREAFKKVFRVFLDEANYPIAFHCIAGQDRTGAVAYTLLALLGVDEEEIWKDWEASGFWNKESGWLNFTNFNKLVRVFDAYEGKNPREKAEKLVLSLGFTQADIDHFRSLMLED